ITLHNPSRFLFSLPLLCCWFALNPRRPLPSPPGRASPAPTAVFPGDPAGTRTVPASKRTFPSTQIDDLLNPPDWFPEEHAPAPQIVKFGHGDALACGACHLMSGSGHPDSADLTGHSAAYIIIQLEDFRTGARKNSQRM